MRMRIIAVAILLLSSAVSHAQQWRVEIGTGLQPLHMGFIGNIPSPAAEERLAEQGQRLDERDGFFPNIFISGVWNYTEHWELVLTGDYCWSHHRVIQYGQFGIDPQGRPRYNLREWSKGRRIDSSPIASATLQWRRLLNPRNAVKAYSAIGLGINSGSSFIFTPSVTLIGLRYGGRHIYGYLEAPLSPYATFVAGGLGWSF